MGFPVFSGVTLFLTLLGPYYAIYNFSSISETTGINSLLMSSMFYSVVACFLKSLFLASIPVTFLSQGFVIEYLGVFTKVFYFYFMYRLINSKASKQHEVEIRLNTCITGWCVAHTMLTYFIPLVTDSSLTSDFSLEYIRLILSSYSASLSTFVCFYCTYMYSKPSLYDRKGIMLLAVSSAFLIQTLSMSLFGIFGLNNITPFINFPIFSYLAFYTHYNFNLQKKKALYKK
ncbi:hypothetical protein FG386_000546 [Cryptosporidium ryanae]|uniref:uncharacterized protein n=1 Tax=Cryptosporidium ryanae TaxID=515981 RepID=UPI003519F018|nr:hypothetical protein FG386_000546 [Cryptosporidium ryanae]